MLKCKLRSLPSSSAFVGRSSARPRSRHRLRPCNICGERFRAATPQCCFCEDCKLHSDLYRFHDWLPDALEAA